MTVLVTGATGFLGSHLVRTLLRKKYKVVILKRSRSDTWRLSDVIDQIFSIDVETQGVEEAFISHEINLVIHTACNYGRNGETIKKVVEANLLFGIEVLENSIKYNTDTFFNTDTLLQKHLNVYTRSKKQFIEWLKMLSANIQVVNLKLEHMYGPQDDTNKFVPWVISQLFEGVDEIKLTKGEQKRDFIFVGDVVDAYIRVINNVHSFEKYCEFEIGNGNSISVRDLVIKIKNIFDTEIKTTKTKLNFGAHDYRIGEIMDSKANIFNLTNIGWTPMISLGEGIIRTINSMNDKCLH